MSIISKFFLNFIIVSSFLLAGSIFAADDKPNISILCYHNFNPIKPGLMNLTPERFETQVKWLKEHDFSFITLKDAVEYLQGKRPSIPQKSVVITADDGWQSVYTYLYPIAKKYNVPVTLFIYPETISQGKNAMTWKELKELQATGMFDIQSHTLSHPNFKQERKRLSQAAYEKFVKNELEKSKKILEDKLNTHVNLLAWPFGIYDEFLENEAQKAGYDMAFSIDAQKANREYPPMAQPRYMILQGLTMKSFEKILNRKR